MKNLEHNQLTIIDTRSGSQTLKFTLDSDQAIIYQMLDDPTSLRSLLAQLSHTGTPQLSNTNYVCGTLDYFINAGLAIKEKNTYLGLALPDDIPNIQIERRFHHF